ncbi:MAG: TetR/AcrR family transcriptional regulator [Bacteroidota bacterium]|nr:TetR/AcrR family transcriptional regulator [Bacteroidota bacterium]
MADIKEQILETSTRLFMKYGLRSVTIDDICNELRISKKTFYNYFRQKEELIESIMESYCEQHKNEHQKNHSFTDDPSLNAIDIVVKASQFWIDQENKESMTFFYDLMKYYPEINSKMYAKMDEDALLSIKKWLQNGINEGIIRTDTDIDLLSIYLNNHFRKGLPDLLNKPGIDIVKTFQFLLDCCIRIIVNENGYQYYQEKYKNNYPPLKTTKTRRTQK